MRISRFACLLAIACVAMAASDKKISEPAASAATLSLPYYRVSPVEVTSLTMKPLSELSLHAFLFFYEPWLNASVDRLQWLTQANAAELHNVSLKEFFVGYIQVDEPQPDQIIAPELDMSLQLLYKHTNEKEWKRCCGSPVMLRSAPILIVSFLPFSMQIDSTDDISRHIHAALNWTRNAIELVCHVSLASLASESNLNNRCYSRLIHFRN